MEETVNRVLGSRFLVRSLLYDVLNTTYIYIYIYIWVSLCCNSRHFSILIEVFTVYYYYYYYTFFLFFFFILFVFFFFFFLFLRYNIYTVLACSTTFFQLSLFCANFFQLLMFMLFYIFQNVSFPTCFRSFSWSFRHGFPSLNILHNIILSHAFNMA